MENNREKGTRIEELAAAFLAGKGMRILEQNYRDRRGELDIIGVHEGYLVFVEVKYRATGDKGSPQEAVGPRKQRTICAVADHYRYLHRMGADVPVRFDVVAVLGDEICWYRNAFPYRGGI